MLSTRSAFGFNFSPDADLPGFRVDPLEGVPGFRIGQDGSVPRTFPGRSDVPGSSYGSYGSNDTNPFAQLPIPPTDPSFSRNPFSLPLADDGPWHPYSSWPTPQSEGGSGGKFSSAEASLVPVADVRTAFSAVPFGYDPHAGPPQLTTPAVFGLPGRFAAVGNPLGATPAVGNGTPGGVGEGLTLARYAPDEEPNQYGSDQAQALPPPPRPPLQRDRSPGTVVVLPDGSNIPDPGSPTGLLMSPMADLSAVAAEGRQAKEVYQMMRSKPWTRGLARLPQLLMLGLNAGQGGTFDYQRRGNRITGYTHLTQFQPVSNFNVGLFGQQAGLTLEELLSIAGDFACNFSGNAKPGEPYCLDPIQLKFITEGFKTGQSGAFDPPSTRFGYPL